MFTNSIAAISHIPEEYPEGLVTTLPPEGILEEEWSPKKEFLAARPPAYRLVEAYWEHLLEKAADQLLINSGLEGLQLVLDRDAFEGRLAHALD